MIEHRVHGSAQAAGPVVFALHGGPGAPGSMAPVARELARRYLVIEPFERRSEAGSPLTVAGHLADLAELVEASAPGRPRALVGSSWGAMLALAYAAEFRAGHSAAVQTLILVGCGTFDAGTRELYQANVAARLAAGDPAVPQRLKRLEERVRAGELDPDEGLSRAGRALLPAYSVDPDPGAPGGDSLELARCDAQGHGESWADMLRLQEGGSYPQSFRAIRTPVHMLHGEQDPHPGTAIRDSLRAFIPHLEYLGLPDCGHYPWLERGARAGFHRALGERLAQDFEPFLPA